MRFKHKHMEDGLWTDSMQSPFVDSEPSATAMDADRAAEQWYDSAPLFPGGSTEQLWRGFPLFQFNSRPFGKLAKP